MADTEPVTYVTASQHLTGARRGRPSGGRLGNVASTSRTLNYLERRQTFGIPPTVASALASVHDHFEWLASTFSIAGLHRLSETTVTARDVTLLRQCVELNLSRTRGYLSKTTLTVAEIHCLMELDVPSQQCRAWSARHRDLADGTSSENAPVGGESANLRAGSPRMTLASVLTSAVIAHGVPRDQVPGWVRYANRHRLRADSPSHGWTFLGGDTALMTRAGISHAEAERMARQGHSDRESLRVLAALREGRLSL